MKKILLPIIISLLMSSPAILNAQKTAEGTVYVDNNNNGELDGNEERLFGVAVSNGSDVVKTNEDGEYSIQINEDDATIFVIKPAGYRLPVNELNQPQFYYIHTPDGSPELEFDGVEPTGPLPEAINFPLLEDVQKNEFSVLLFGDPQPYTEREVEYFDKDIVSELEGTEEYEFGITLGDIVGDDLDLFQPYIESVSKIGLPWFHVYGNHDMNFDANSDSLADETFEATFGPPTYSFNHGNAHFIVLDDVVYPREDGESGYIGGFTDKQFEFIKNDLEYVSEDQLVVIAFHIPIFMPDGWGRTFRIENRDRLFDLLKKYPNTLTLSAHTHIQKFHFFDDKDEWKRLEPHIHYNVGTTNGDWWSGQVDERGIPPTLMRDGTPNGYAMLNIEGNEYTIDYKVADKPEDYRLSKWGPEIVPQDSWHGAELYVNYFLGNEYTEVEFRVQNEWESWRPMNKVEEQDPHVTKLRQKWDTADELPEEGRRPSNPIQSSHLWKAGVPNNLPLGEHTIEIRVTDMFGRTFTDEFKYEIVEPNQ
ncbi:calcineurin-like phosphoesterase family protein [Aliifodinibius salicampi]|uniref:Calcineurin-like phosphoesterase family protein n=1 Tax=Fodinibius salicampi TaxID=1920655 RepID=A0ABT3Q1U2_9BACT|nr:calcineurin-like phosphoesterase family protein [Fodinibius salicampi]MCW9713988.1 calcineurin-like phosphoesterase family protein [Fodinibius salicampi]